MKIKKIRASGVEASLYRCLICWMGNHQVVIHSSFIVTSAFPTTTSLTIAISNSTVRQAHLHLGRFVFIASRMASP
jgi:hypothetical protein